MNIELLKKTIESAWDERDTVTTETSGEIRDAIEETLEMLDKGKVRVAENVSGNWCVHQWLKKTVLLFLT